MSGQGIAQILLYAVVLTALAYPLGGYMARVYTRERFAAGRLFGWLNPASAASIDWCALTRAASRIGRATRRRCSSSASCSRPCSTRSSVCKATLPEPRQPAGCAVAHRTQHDRELRHEHELAVLRRRVHDVVPDADDRPGGADSSSPPPSAWRCSSRSCAASHAGPRTSSATSGPTSTARSSTSCSRSR